MLNERRGKDQVDKWLIRAEKDCRIVPAMSAEVVGEITAHIAYTEEMEKVVNVLEVSERALEAKVAAQEVTIATLKKHVTDIGGLVGEKPWTL